MNRVNNVDMPRRTIWTQGDAMSWVLGVLLGGFLGLVLLIATPIILRNAATPAAATSTASTSTASTSTSTATAPAATTPAASTPASSETPAASGGAAPTGNADAGKAAFAACAACHGANAAGGAIGPTLVAAKGPKDWTFEQFKLAITQGKAPEKELAPTMPRQPQMTDQQLADLQAFLKTAK